MMYIQFIKIWLLSQGRTDTSAPLIDTKTFLKKFEAGSLGDEQDFFDWYAFYKLLNRWSKTQNALRSVIK